MTKIAFLFLTQKDFTQEKLWIDYFSGVDNEKYSMYFHAKPGFVHENFSKFQINSIPTEWGRFSLIEAQQLLLNESLLDEKNTHFIFVSESTIPISNFDDFYKYLNEKNEHSIFEGEKCRMPSHCSRFNTINNLQNWKSDVWCTNPQWVLFNREHSIFLKNNFELIKSIFINSQHPEEHCYSTFLNINLKLNEKNYINKSLTYVDWSGHNGTYPSQYNIHEITDEFKENLKKSNFFFIRKIIKN